MVQKLFGTVTESAWPCWALPSRPTPTIPAKHLVRICCDLLEEGAQLAIHDPKVEIDQIARDLHLEASAVPDPNPAL